MNNEKRVMIAFAVCVVYFLAVAMWQSAHVKPPVKTKAAAEAKAGLPAKNAVVAGAPAKKAAAPPPAPVQLPTVEGSTAQDIVVENDLYKITFSTQGAVVKSWILRKFQDHEGKPLDVVNPVACDQMGYPFRLKLENSDLASRLNQAVYVAKPAESKLTSPATLDFEYSDGKVRVEKKFTFGANYEIHAQVSVFDGQHDLPVSVEWPGGVGDHSIGIPMEEATSLAFYESGAGLKTVEEHKVKGEQTISGPLAFAGIEDKYFAGVFFPKSGEEQFEFANKSWTPKEDKKDEEKKPSTALVGVLGSGKSGPLDFRLLIAPKKLAVLEATNPPTDALVDFGVFHIFAKPLFYALRYVYNNWVHNYGWAIVILTFILNMAFFPLKVKTIRSAQEMQRISPLVKAIQDRYKQYKFNDPRKQRMNQEVMKLYQEHHINPLGGCLPMLPQIPIMWGFYESLEAPFAFRHAPWIFWIKDLSQPDTSHLLGLPIPILPAIMVVAFYFSTKMTPMPTTDPAQKRMMTIMPIFMGILFFKLPSGLVLYMLAMSMVQILQQLIINRYYSPKTPPPAADSKPAVMAKA